MRVLTTLCCTVVLAALAGCADSGSTNNNPADIGPAKTASGAKHIISIEDSGKTLKPAVGDHILFTAEENPSTGYMWSAAYGKDVLEESESTHEATQTDPQIVGAPGVRKMDFLVKAAGSTTLELTYVRPFDPDHPATKVAVKIDAK